MQSNPRDPETADEPFDDTDAVENSYSGSGSDRIEQREIDEEYDEEEVEEFYETAPSSSSSKKSKKRKIYCFNCNRQEFHLMAYKGSWVHSFLVGMSFGLGRFVGPYRCTCCGKKRAMFADFCSPAYHWRMYSERRQSDSSTNPSSRSRSSRSRSGSRRSSSGVATAKTKYRQNY